MRGLTERAVLLIWEHGISMTWHERALLIAAAATPEYSAEALSQLSIGQRDTILLHIREQLFGSTMESVVTCSQCNEQLEITFHTTDFRPPTTSTSVSHTLELDGFVVAFRAVNTLDLTIITRALDSYEARQLLFERCIQQIEHAGKAVEIQSLPERVLQQLEAAIGESDPQANIHLMLQCPDCEHQWSVVFDIVPFLWQEITVFARRLMEEIHVLARVYGWSESEILALSAWRRRVYLEMALG